VAGFCKIPCSFPCSQNHEDGISSASSGETQRDASAQDWYAGTLVSRLNDKENGPIIVIMQRLHQHDLAGHLIEQGRWLHLDLPAIALDDSIIPIGHGKLITRRRGEVLHAERESKAVLDQIKAEIGSLMFSAQYQQRPVPLEGNLIRREWFRFYVQPPRPGLVVQSWDVAMMTGEANDFSQAAGRGEGAILKDRRHRTPQRQFAELLAVAN
jgi:hypothetical protein